MMLQPTPEMLELREQIEKAHDKDEKEKLLEEYKRLVIEQDKLWDNSPFVH
jgi:hypothetical protein